MSTKPRNPPLAIRLLPSLDPVQHLPLHTMLHVSTTDQGLQDLLNCMFRIALTGKILNDQMFRDLLKRNLLLDCHKAYGQKPNAYLGSDSETVLQLLFNP